jgi:hypothetical protein
MNLKGNEMNFALCLNNEGYNASLEVGKLYRMVNDDEASVHGYIRIIDESGEDYAFQLDRFHVIELPFTIEQALLSGGYQVDNNSSTLTYI